MSHPTTSPTPAAGESRLAQTQAIFGNALLGVLFAFFAMAAYQSWLGSGHIQMLLLAIQEAVVVGLVITRRRTNDVSSAAWDWAVALAGTAAPLLQRPADPPFPALEPLGIAIQILGAALSLGATLSLGRSFGIVAANRGVRTTGLYRLVRHPLYGSYLVGYIGFLIGSGTLLNVLLIILAVACQYGRAVAEERVLLRDPAYQSYAARVRYRFFPGIF